MDNPVRLTTDSRRDFSPAWSPDGQTIAFGRIVSNARSAVYLIPVHGGPERKLVESVTPAPFAGALRRVVARWEMDCL